jgi:hypothetical protein
MVHKFWFICLFYCDVDFTIQYEQTSRILEQSPQGLFLVFYKFYVKAQAVKSPKSAASDLAILVFDAFWF